MRVPFTQTPSMPMLRATRRSAPAGKSAILSSGPCEIESGSKTTKVDLLHIYIARHDVDVHRMVMIGDRTSDVEAAQAIGCRFIGCDYGHGYREEIDGAGPIVSTFAQLPGAIRELGL